MTGDFVRCQYDRWRGTLAFGVNGDEPQIAFDNIPPAVFHPFVLFFMATPGEKVTFKKKYYQWILSVQNSVRLIEIPLYKNSFA